MRPVEATGDLSLVLDADYLDGAERLLLEEVNLAVRRAREMEEGDEGRYLVFPPLRGDELFEGDGPLLPGDEREYLLVDVLDDLGDVAPLLRHLHLRDLYLPEHALLAHFEGLAQRSHEVV